MNGYTAPIQDMRFLLESVVGLDAARALPGYEEATPDLLEAVLEEAGKLASQVLAPLNQPGDRQGSRIENGVVRTPEGWAAAYAKFVEGGWPSVPFDTEHGGQGLPWAVHTPLAEMWSSANLAFSLCPMLSVGAAEVLAVHGTAAQKSLYLTPLVEGRWTGTMNLTEPQAGSDLGQIRTRAVREGGHYRITGQKIYITYGEHDIAENIVHLVLARLPDAPAGVRGISLFIVPKRMVGADGALGAHNDLRCVSLERKMGIHASPTCVMAYGDQGGAVGYLVGEENRGLEYMFTMMNNERLGVGVQGIAIAERAYQLARDHARLRVQGRDDASAGREPVAIIRHPDVRRMLMTMRALTEASRALAYQTAVLLDRVRRHPDEAERRHSQSLVDFLTPVVKAWGTDVACEVASLGVQIHGGMGFVEDSGAAQLFRDARITPIYEGTNGIQARDLVGRKLLREGGEIARRLEAEIRALDAKLAQAGGEEMAAIRRGLADGARALAEATGWLLDAAKKDPLAPAAGATHYLALVGIVAGGWMMARAALATAESEKAAGDGTFLAAKRATARFYADKILPQSGALLAVIKTGAASTMALAEEQF
ncbi:MAG: acyl-CoA dehydrogenase [Alphaproteobacteria bacterium]